MSAMGQKQTSRHARVMSVIPLKADILQRIEHVCFVPVADIAAVLLAQSMEYQRVAIPYLGAGEVYRQKLSRCSSNHNRFLPKADTL